ncbi:hypothetical protein QWY77_00975 [Thalassotalea ponticola]|uniref:hypothetical protein n=1 Tax=Thalassotalea ponticola TaxID=1523392 RepID=UPI0025B555B8|nr:hypothetical protein [Thalassotalea ponticola]MDN3651358.1 hypothetical protein [Thalassotalea ponticola]
MSLETYQKLKNLSLNVDLPMLCSAKLQLSSKMGTVEDVLTAIETLNPNAGWQMYRDETVTSAELITRKDLIEAQYSDGKNSVHIKLTGNQFRITSFIVSEADTDIEWVYKRQAMYLSNKVSQNKAVFNIWYKQTTESKWQPFAQQFVGFYDEENS